MISDTIEMKELRLPINLQMIDGYMHADIPVKLIQSSAVVMLRGDKVGVHYRHGTSSLRGFYGTAGGKADFKFETAEQVAMEELKEEAGIDLTNGPNLRLRFLRAVPEYKSENEIFICHIFLLSLMPDEQPKNTEPHKHGDYEFVSFEEALQLPLLPGLRYAVEYLAATQFTLKHIEGEGSFATYLVDGRRFEVRHEDDGHHVEKRGTLYVAPRELSEFNKHAWANERIVLAGPGALPKRPVGRVGDVDPGTRWLTQTRLHAIAKTFGMSSIDLKVADEVLKEKR